MDCTCDSIDCSIFTESDFCDSYALNSQTACGAPKDMCGEHTTFDGSRCQPTKDACVGGKIDSKGTCVA